jgi:predicted ATPase/class 3 adenylate cyclase
VNGLYHSIHLMSDLSDRMAIEAAIEAQEQLRDSLGDEIVDVTIAALRAQLLTGSPDPSAEHERRLVTVLFMDVVDSTTRIFRDGDPEETMAIMEAALEALAGPVRACGGRVTGFTGDGFLAVFGLRRTRENDAEMAVRAGLGILETARTVAEEVSRAHQIGAFEVRVGINTGLVVTGDVTDAAGAVTGSVVSLASRIESAAPPGGLLISQSTYRQVRGRFDLEPAGTIDAKGFLEPIPVHLVARERSERSVDVIRGVDDVESEMVGRRTELNALLGAIEEVVATGSGRTVTIIGDAGIGKTRLLAEFESRLPANSPLRRFRARATLEGTDVPYSLLRDLVERCFEIRKDDPAVIARDKLATGLGPYLSGGSAKVAKIEVVGSLLGYIMSGANPPNGSGHSPQQLRDGAVVHLIEFFGAVAREGPVLLMLDDLQWADDSSIAVLQDVIEALASHPLLSIALTRPLLHGTRTEWERLPHHLVLPLERLSGQESESLIDSILSNIEACPPELRTRLLEHAGGNPYYLEELVMMCIDDGVIVVDDPVWSVRMDRLATLRVPTTLTGVIRARLDSLPLREHTALQQASIVGRIFWDDAVTQIARTSDTDAIDAQLRALAARQMIHRRASSAFSHASEYAFSNALLRDATYEAVLLGVRREYHGIVADWLIAMSGDREAEFVGLIAGHLERAGRSAEALEYLTRAGDAAWRSYAITTAADFYDRALALTPEDDLERRYQLLLGREKTAALEGDREEQRRGLDELERIAERLGDRGKQSLVAVERTFLCFYTGSYEAGLTSARRAAEYAAATDDSTLQSRAQTTLAWALYYLKDWGAARTHGEQALNLARRAHGAQSEATAQNLLGMIALTTEALSEARERLKRALDITGDEADRDSAMIYLNNLAVVLTMLGRYGEAHEHFSEILRRAMESGDRSSESAAQVNLAWVASARGAWETARSHAELGIAMKRRHEHREAEAEGLLWLGHALVGLGDLDEAEAAYEASAVIRRELGQTDLGLEAEAGLTRVAIARGDLDGAKSRAEVILHHLDEGESLGGTWEPARVHLAVIETLRASGDDRADHVLHRAHRLLLERAGKIADADDRRSYLEAVPWHRRIGDLAASPSQPG